jgi:CheY-like chemotaxis protein
MANIFIIDDDAAAVMLKENLDYRGHTARRIRSVREALDNLDLLSKSDLVVLDLVMPHGGDLTHQADGSRPNGMLIYKLLRERSRSLPILVYTANQDGGIVDLIDSDPKATYVPRWSGPSLSEFMGIVNSMLGVELDVSPIKVFIVHGHDEVAKLSLKNYLQNTLKLPEPIILHEQPNQGRTIIEKFEDLAAGADLVFVLLTPDDVIASGTESDSAKRRARQNVIFEMGYFLGQLGRRSGRVVLLYKGTLDLPSDISGVIYLNFDSGIESVGEQIRREIAAVSS